MKLSSIEHTEFGYVYFSQLRIKVPHRSGALLTLVAFDDPAGQYYFPSRTTK